MHMHMMHKWPASIEDTIGTTLIRVYTSILIKTEVTPLFYSYNSM